MIAAAIPVGSAIGVGNESVSKVSVPQLQGSSQLQATPNSSVPVPDLPQVEVPQVETPSVPSVETPSVPSVQTPVPGVQTPSVPSVQTPSVPSVQTPSLPSTPGVPGGSSGDVPAAAPSGGGSGSAPAAGGESSSDASTGANGKAGAGSAAAGRGGLTVRDRIRRRAERDERVRNEVRRLSGCLDSIDGDQSDILVLRAGLEGGEAQTRRQAARTLGISRQDARRLERQGLRALRTTCGGGAAPSTFIEHASDAPQLQPAVLLPVTSSGRELVSQDELVAGQQSVKSKTRSSSDGDSGSATGGGVGSPDSRGTTLTLAAATTSPAGPLWIALVAVIALMAAVALLAARGAFGRRTRTAGGGDEPRGRLVAASAVAAPAVASPGTETEAEAEVESAPEPEAEPAGESSESSDWKWPAAAAATAATATTPSKDDTRAQQPTRHQPTVATTPTQPSARKVVRRDYARPAKLAAKGAAGLVSLAAREVKRRREGGR